MTGCHLSVRSVSLWGIRMPKQWVPFAFGGTTTVNTTASSEPFSLAAVAALGTLREFHAVNDDPQTKNVYPKAAFTILETRGFADIAISVGTGPFRPKGVNLISAELAFYTSDAPAGTFEDGDVPAGAYVNTLLGQADPFCTVHWAEVSSLEALTDPPFHSRAKRRVRYRENVLCGMSVYVAEVDAPSGGQVIVAGVCAGRMLVLT